jgi:hypothetical protein
MMLAGFAGLGFMGSRRKAAGAGLAASWKRFGDWHRFSPPARPRTVAEGRVASRHRDHFLSSRRFGDRQTHGAPCDDLRTGRAVSLRRRKTVETRVIDACLSRPA